MSPYAKTVTVTSCGQTQLKLIAGACEPGGSGSTHGARSLNPTGNTPRLTPNLRSINLGLATVCMMNTDPIKLITISDDVTISPGNIRSVISLNGGLLDILRGFGL